MLNEKRTGGYMADEAKIYVCTKCGNMMAMLEDHGCVPFCCGTPAQLLQANTTDAATEKHIPVVTEENGTVTVRVGSAPHPMTEEHSIRWILLITEKGRQRKTLAPGDKPEAVFRITGDDRCLSAEAYCNLHGLWKA